MSFKLKRNLILMIEEKIVAYFIIKGVLNFSFGGFNKYNMRMMGKNFIRIYKIVLHGKRATLDFEYS